MPADPAGPAGGLRTPDEHLAAILTVIEPLPSIQLPLVEAHGCVLAEDVTAAVPIPGFDNSSMDGYAVRSEDLAAAGPGTPVALPVLGDVPAGPGAAARALRVMPGRCVRIMTGAPLPAGADAVVPVEWTDGATGTVLVHRAPRPGQFVRRAGEDVAAGAVVLADGVPLGAAATGLLATAGRARIRCRPRPRVVVVATGSELVEPGEPLAPGQIHDSNSYALAAAVHEAGGIPYRARAIADDGSRVLAQLEDHLLRADMLITTGGVSVGAYDVVKAALTPLGTVEFCRVAMQPGMPQGFGTLGPDHTPIFTLPGNPVSALVSFEIFVRPALRRMLGAEPLTRPTVPAVLTEPLSSPPGRRQYARVRLSDGPGGTRLATPTGGQGSHLLAGYVAADALLVVPEDATDIPAGTTLPALLLERRTR